MPLTHLNSRTFEELKDPKREAIGRCLAVLHSASITVPVLARNVKHRDQELVTQALAQLVFDLMEHGQSLQQDIQVLAKMVGCEVIFADPRKGAQN